MLRRLKTLLPCVVLVGSLAVLLFTLLTRESESCTGESCLKDIGARKSASISTSSSPAMTSLSDTKRKSKLVIFTTFKECDERTLYSTNVLNNWSLFGDFLIPVLYTNDTESSLSITARNLNWIVFYIEEKNEYGTPLLKPMVQKIREEFPDADYYGFANGDILFDNSLKRTLEYFLASDDSSIANQVMVGRRTNVPIPYDSKEAAVYEHDTVSLLMRTGSLFITDAQDYFIFKGEYPWHLIPDFAIGRPGYDNFLVYFAVENKLTLIDLTATCSALHQTGSDGNFAGIQNGDFAYNRNLMASEIMKDEYDLWKGMISSASMCTLHDVLGNIYLKKVVPNYLLPEHLDDRRKYVVLRENRRQLIASYNNKPILKGVKTN